MAVAVAGGAWGGVGSVAGAAAAQARALRDASGAGSSPFVSGLGSRLSAQERAILAGASDLGPYRGTASVLVNLGAGQTLEALAAWAQGHHLVVGASGADGADGAQGSGSWAVLGGRAAALGRALGVRVDEFRGADGRTFYASTTPVHVPASMRSVVSAVGSVDSYRGVRRLDVPEGGLSASGIAKAYDAGPLLTQGINGQGETIVFFETDGFHNSDFNTFAARNHLPPLQVTVLGGQAGRPAGEAEMDIEVAHGLAPAAKLVYVNFGRVQTEGQMVSLLRTVSTRYPGAIWSLSLGICEGDSFFSSTLLEDMDKQMVAAERAGTTVFVASGDSGDLECTPPGSFGKGPRNSFLGVNLLASFPAVVAVGGTSLSVDSSGRYAGEQTWTESMLSQGSSGGISQIWNQPSWQTGPGTRDFGGRSPGRQLPDVAAIADEANGFAAYQSGSSEETGGTSLATPVWAGFTALMDQYLARAHLPTVGLFTPALYQIAGSSTSPYPAFHDVTEGGGALYSASTGYDMATGLGSLDVWNLVRDLVALDGGKR